MGIQLFEGKVMGEIFYITSIMFEFVFIVLLILSLWLRGMWKGTEGQCV